MQCSDTFSTEAVHYKKAEPDRPESDHAHAHSRHASSSISQSHGKPSQRGTKAVQKNSGNTWGTCDLSGAHQGLSQLFEGFRLIAKSGYLCHVCLHFVMHYLISTFFYFEKTLVVASSGGSASQRVATFATINSMSAGAVALIQLTATVYRHAHTNWITTAASKSPCQPGTGSCSSALQPVCSGHMLQGCMLSIGPVSRLFQCMPQQVAGRCMTVSELSIRICSYCQMLHASIR